MLIKRAPFIRLVREIIQRHKLEYRVSPDTILALQESSKAFLCGLFEVGNIYFYKF